MKYLHIYSFRIDILSNDRWTSFHRLVKAIEVLEHRDFNTKIVNTILYSRAFLSKKI